MEEHRPRVFDKSETRKYFSIRGRNCQQTAEYCIMRSFIYLHFLPIRWAGHVARLGERKIHVKY